MGLRGFLDTHRPATQFAAPGDEAWLEWDLNTPADYEDALRNFPPNPADTIPS